MNVATEKPGGGCPMHGQGGRANRDWWPNRLSLQMLYQHSPRSNPMGEAFDYAKEFETLDLDAVDQADLRALMTEFAGLVAGRFRPLRRPVHPHGLAQRRHLSHRRRPRRRRRRPAALRPAQQLARQRQSRQGAPPAVADQAEIRRKMSWADLFVLTGNVALETMGFKTFGFGGGRVDTWEPEELYWGPEGTWLGDERYSGERELRTARRGADGPDLRQPRRARTASPTRSRRPATSAKPSPAWR